MSEANIVCYFVILLFCYFVILLFCYFVSNSITHSDSIIAVLSLFFPIRIRRLGILIDVVYLFVVNKRQKDHRLIFRTRAGIGKALL
jgi:hypothetical protein